MKKSHRILRDAIIVIVFCVGFLGLIGLANFLQHTPAEQTSSEFSEYRLEADQAAQGHDLEASSENLRALIKNDPYDGRAQYELASILYSRVIEAQDLLAESKPNESPSSSVQQGQAEPGSQTEPKDGSEQRSLEPSTASSTSAPETASESVAQAQANDQIQVLIDQAIQEFKLAARHARYRRRSQVQLAMLLATKGDYEAAIDNLEMFVEAGGATRRGLDQIEQFGSGLETATPTKLHADQRFLKIIEREQENRIGQGNFSRQKSKSQRLTGIWKFLDRLNDYLIPLRIKLVNFVSELFK